MKPAIKTVAFCSGLLTLASLPAAAQVSLSIDTATTLTQTTWSGSPALSLNNPNGGSSIDGNLTDGIVFQPTSTFTLGSFEFYAGNGGAGATSIGTYDIALYNLGSSYSLPSSSPLYTFTGSEADLLDSGLSFTTTSDAQFNVLTFSGDDNVTLTAGDTYLLTIVAASGEYMDIERGSGTTGNANANFSTQALGLATAVPAASVALNNVGAGHRDAVGTFYAEPVPEPTSLALAGGGCVLLGLMRRFRK